MKELMLRMKVRGCRALLNPSGIHTTAAIVAEVQDTRKWKPGCTEQGKPIDFEDMWSAEPRITLQVSNCDRSIALTFGQWDSARNRQVDLQKVDRLMRALTDFRAALVDEQNLYLERIKIARRNKSTQED